VRRTDKVQLFANMPVRGMTPEQFFDSVAKVTDYDDPITARSSTKPSARGRRGKSSCRGSLRRTSGSGRRLRFCKR